MTAAGKKYFRQIKKQVLARGDQRTRFLNAMENRVLEYTQDTPDATVEELCEKLGEPEVIGQQQIDELSNKEIHHRMRGGKIALRGLVITILVAALAVALTVTWLVVENNKVENGYTRDKIDCPDSEELP